MSHIIRCWHTMISMWKIHKISFISLTHICTRACVRACAHTHTHTHTHIHTHSILPNKHQSGAGIFCVITRFHTTSVAWNLGINTWNSIPTTPHMNAPINLRIFIFIFDIQSWVHVSPNLSLSFFPANSITCKLSGLYTTDSNLHVFHHTYWGEYVPCIQLLACTFTPWNLLEKHIK